MNKLADFYLPLPLEIYNITDSMSSISKGNSILHKNLRTSPKKGFDNSIPEEPNLQNNKSAYMSQTIQPKKGHQIDDYEGPVDPITRLRHGTGTYHFANRFFTYTGNYNQGVKQGKGCLKMNDGTIINGIFVNNQLSGDAEIRYNDGSTYVGSLKNGQKSGYGKFVSKFESYEGQYMQNKKHGDGVFKNKTTTIVGKFHNNKPDGQNISITKYNYQYKGACVAGLKHGRGVQRSTYVQDNYQYEGEFSNDRFHGEGLYINYSKIGYKYEGKFNNGLPGIYPNQFRVLMAISIGVDSPVPAVESFTNISSQQTLGTPIQYQLESENQLNLIIQSCYQGPEELDPNQPTQQDIQKMIKDWQNQNKKNKNPPPMPDFRQPRMIRPSLVVISQESLRSIDIKLSKLQGNQSKYMKIDYRQAISKKRAENQILKAEALKKAEQQGNKKGGKGPAKGQIELKVTGYTENPSMDQKILRLTNQKGSTRVQKLQFPDDFPPGSYWMTISSPFNLFGQIKQVKKPINIKAKNSGGKKK